MDRILIVEDEPRIAAFVERACRAEGFDTMSVDDGLDAKEVILNPDVDLIILDIGLPSMDGMELLEYMRDQGSSTPVIVLTAHSTTRDTVMGLDLGASDYVAKPFRVEELMARVRSRLRERGAEAPTVLVHSGVTLDILTRRANVAGRNVDLSSREYTLLEQFLRRPGEVLTRAELLKTVWGLDFDPGSNVVDVYVRYLRAKFGPSRITTIRGEGYRWG